ncbi:MAG: hypothetical protein DWQ35_12100 [Planctomycetota bacterium]|nr:MAG: hypothetical protein DWQ35_12100 [Planctomycetota bacterium]REK30365.1 MAG: hypothetical protein DWQ42_01775 [Planctomycetota bacterium]REK40248.1 MAG: hypothetical protein DWQ46_16820 [Planctomycetota bacterium]
MKQADVNRAVARATGETVSTIKRLGFLLAEPAEISDPEAEELGPLVIDWDEVDLCRREDVEEAAHHAPAVA